MAELATVSGTGDATITISSNLRTSYNTADWWCETGSWKFGDGTIHSAANGGSGIAYFYTCECPWGNWCARFDFRSNAPNEPFYGRVICYRQNIFLGMSAAPPIPVCPTF